MPRREQVIVVLAASPSDLEPERTQLEAVIRELNLSWSQSPWVSGSNSFAGTHTDIRALGTIRRMY